MNRNYLTTNELMTQSNVGSIFEQSVNTCITWVAELTRWSAKWRLVLGSKIVRFIAYRCDSNDKILIRTTLSQFNPNHIGITHNSFWALLGTKGCPAPFHVHFYSNFSFFFYWISHLSNILYHNFLEHVGLQFIVCCLVLDISASSICCVFMSNLLSNL